MKRLIVVMNIVALFFVCGSAFGNLDDTIVRFADKKSFTEKILEEALFNALFKIMDVEKVGLVKILAEAREFTYEKNRGWALHY